MIIRTKALTRVLCHTFVPIFRKWFQSLKFLSDFAGIAFLTYTIRCALSATMLKSIRECLVVITIQSYDDSVSAEGETEASSIPFSVYTEGMYRSWYYITPPFGWIYSIIFRAADSRGSSISFLYATPRKIIFDPDIGFLCLFCSDWIFTVILCGMLLSMFPVILIMVGHSGMLGKLNK